MLCQNCKQRPAQIHFTKVINNQKEEFHLCEECADEQSQIGFNYPFSINDFLAGFLDMPIGYQLKGSVSNQKNIFKCSSCGLTFDEFKRGGKLGCAKCYRTFNEYIIPMLKKLHGSTHHSGKVPKRSGRISEEKNEIEELKKQLEKAVIKEDYEKAAKIRDQIRLINQNRR